MKTGTVNNMKIPRLFWHFWLFPIRGLHCAFYKALKNTTTPHTAFVWRNPNAALAKFRDIDILASEKLFLSPTHHLVTTKYWLTSPGLPRRCSLWESPIGEAAYFVWIVNRTTTRRLSFSERSPKSWRRKPSGTPALYSSPSVQFVLCHCRCERKSSPLCGLQGARATLDWIVDVWLTGC